jgi:radical SAM protein with 4Fe4S-binding SPASM domain
MKFSKQLHSLGYIATAPKQGIKKKQGGSSEVKHNQQMIDICLNCTRPKCSGGCKAIKMKGGAE